jgi:hypothetical protein
MDLVNLMSFIEELEYALDKKGSNFATQVIKSTWANVDKFEKFYG